MVLWINIMGVILSKKRALSGSLALCHHVMRPHHVMMQEGSREMSGLCSWVSQSLKCELKKLLFFIEKEKFYREIRIDVDIPLFIDEERKLICLVSNSIESEITSGVFNSRFSTLSLSYNTIKSTKIHHSFH